MRPERRTQCSRPKSRDATRNADARARWREHPARRGLVWLTLLLACLAMYQPAVGQQAPLGELLDPETPGGLFSTGPDDWTSPDGLSSTLQVMILLTVISMAPAVMLMTTCFVRIVVVLGLMRQAIGTQQLPPAQVITSLAMFMSLVIMTPVWQQVYDEAIGPYTNREKTVSQAWEDGIRPVRQFMIMQIEATGNREEVWLFLDYLQPEGETDPETYDDVPLQALLPAFMLSELETAFLIGFQIYIPFVILDLVIASVTISMGMLMLPPVIISLPFKLLLFVLVDGWHLVVGMLMQSFQPFL
ncbi:MAG: flagellar biosynthetic protein FliP [Planctomycetota bacterium]|nr:MAG: flagellar biosynthetic protein FliP [Planctomycetota bacterium]REJ94375.1 MAG: flagellar biosynthetic protein FliP [Planctomycetota bacterium]REK22092.1 MAG: flagellar biosynthetic protein FliP [Planctomycetota bacterium]REK44500.1 MAG: flagellar biosynthetic protein FliP [Planctomycetota bacterium]